MRGTKSFGGAGCYPAPPHDLVRGTKRPLALSAAQEWLRARHEAAMGLPAQNLEVFRRPAQRPPKAKGGLPAQVWGTFGGAESDFGRC